MSESYYITHTQLRELANSQDYTLIPLVIKIKKTQKLRKTERKESLTKGLIKALVKFARAVKEKKRNKIHLQHDTNLTKSQFTNFQKLQYFDLVSKTDIAGCWKLTPLGLAFIKGELTISKYVIVDHNKTVRWSDEQVSFEDIIEFDTWYQKKEDYQKNSL